VVSLASAARADETKMEHVQTALSNTTLSGYVDTSAMWNTGSQNGASGTPTATTGGLPPYTPGGTHGDGFNLNAVDLALDKPMDESPWASGYHVEMMFGQDAIQANAQASNIRSAYVAVRTPIGNTAIDWKMGVWDTPLGYESSSAPLNPNFTRSYGYFLEPTSATGILATFKANDVLSLSAGVANASTGNAQNGYSTATPPAGGGTAYESQKAYIGLVTLTAPDTWGWMKGATLTGGIINADVASAPNGGGRTWLYVGSVIPTPVEGLKFGVAFDYVDYHNANTTPPGPGFNPANDNIYAVAGYLNYQCNDKLSFGVRGEVLNGDGAGFSTSPIGQFGSNQYAINGHTVTELTATVTYKLWENVLSRVEARWDRAGAKAWDNANGSGPTHQNEFLLAADLCYQF